MILAPEGPKERTSRMTEESQKSFNDFVELASDIVSSYVSNNSVPASELPGLIINVHAALTGLGGLVTSTVLNLLVLPTLALRYGRFGTPRPAV